MAWDYRMGNMKSIIQTYTQDKETYHYHHCFNLCFPILAWVRQNLLEICISIAGSPSLLPIINLFPSKEGKVSPWPDLLS